VDLLHRHVLEAPGHHRGERLVEAVLLDLPRLLGRRRLAIDQLVPGELEVEHHRVHLAVRLEPRGAEQLVTDSRLPISERGESKAVGEPPRRIDGEDQRLLALDREAERQPGRGGGPADPARSSGAKRGVKRPLRRRTPWGKPRWGRARCISMASLAGISSGKVTMQVLACCGSLSIESMNFMSRASGPSFTMLRKTSGTLRKVRPWPVAGASSTTRSQRGRPCSISRPACQATLPSMTISASDGAALRKYRTQRRSKTRL